MLRFLLSIEEVLGENVTDMTACSTGENLLRTPSLNVTPTCSETWIYPLSYEALQWFTEALSNLMHSWNCHLHKSDKPADMEASNYHVFLIL